MPLPFEGFTRSPRNKDFSPIVFNGCTDPFRVVPKALWIGDVEIKNTISYHVLFLLSLGDFLGLMKRMNIVLFSPFHCLYSFASVRLYSNPKRTCVNWT